MARQWVAVAGIVLFAVAAGAQQAPAPAESKEKLSYALGMDLGNQLRKQKMDVDPDVFARGMKDALAGTKTALTEEEVKRLIGAMQESQRRKLIGQQGERILGDKAKSDGESFLAANRGKEGVVTLPSGLQYKVMRAGAGKKPSASNTVTVHYRATFVDGTEFENTYKTNQPKTLKVANAGLEGLSQALPLMSTGSKWQVVLPATLAYGDAGAGRKIGPNTTLVYEMELLSVD